jgi:hypothetical protein
MFNQNLDTSMFNITKAENATNIQRHLEKTSERELFQGQRFYPESFNISDINSTMININVKYKDYLIIVEPKDAFILTWEVVYLRWNCLYV